MPNTPSDKDKVVTEPGNQAAAAEEKAGEQSTVENAVPAPEPANRQPEEPSTTIEEHRTDAETGRAREVSPAPDEDRKFELEGKMVAYTGAIALWTRRMAFLAIIAAIISFLQFCAIQQTVKQNQVMLDTAAKQANSAQAQTNLSERSVNLAINSAAEQSNVTARTLELTGKSVNATEKAASAASTQANASLSQAGTSKISASAARESAQVSRNLYEASQRPKVFFKRVFWREKPSAAKKFDAQFVVSNSGGTAFKVVLDMITAVILSPFPDALPSVPNAELQRWDAPFEQGAEQSLTTNSEPMLNEDGIKNLEDEKLFIVFYGHIWWEDSLGRKEGIPYCRVYNKRIYPDLATCPKNVKVPERAHP